MGGMIVVKEPGDDIPGPVGGFLLAPPGHVRGIPSNELQAAVGGILIGLSLQVGADLPAPRAFKRRVDKTIEEIARVLQGKPGGRWRGALPA
jgi:hypothetical protein